MHTTGHLQLPDYFVPFSGLGGSKAVAVSAVKTGNLVSQHPFVFAGLHNFDDVLANLLSCIHYRLPGYGIVFIDFRQNELYP